jgi:hypothetical protein
MYKFEKYAANPNKHKDCKPVACVMSLNLGTKHFSQGKHRPLCHLEALYPTVVLKFLYNKTREPGRRPRPNPISQIVPSDCKYRQHPNMMSNSKNRAIPPPPNTYPSSPVKSSSLLLTSSLSGEFATSRACCEFSSKSNTIDNTAKTSVGSTNPAIAANQ